MKRLVRGITRDIQAALNGLAYAHVAEPSSVRDKIRLLDPSGTDGAPLGRAVVLAINARLEPAALKYAISVCQRMNADLDVLCVSSLEQAEAALAPHHEILATAGIRHRVIMSQGTVPSAIAAYVAQQPDILAAVAGSGEVIDMLDGQGRRRSRRARWTANFPLVVVAEQT